MGRVLCLLHVCTQDTIVWHLIYHLCQAQKMSRGAMPDTADTQWDVQRQDRSIALLFPAPLPLSAPPWLVVKEHEGAGRPIQTKTLSPTL